MRIGVVSDTHDRADNVRALVALFDRLAVERVIHTGDITTARTFDLFAALRCPLVAVLGNNDHDREGLFEVGARHGFALDTEHELDWSGRRILVVHDPAEVTARHLAGCDVILHGHTHRHTLERRHGCLIFNPGECASLQAGANAIGVLDLENLQAQTHRF